MIDFNRMSPKILVVDDDRKTVELVQLYLESEGFQVVKAFDGLQAIESARMDAPDLILLDLMLPKIEGTDVFKTIRRESDVPIIMLTARTTEEDKLTGLNIGADDYITKPFSPREVTARVRAVLRRSGGLENQADSVIILGDLVIDLIRYEARIRGKSLHLTPKEFRILETLVRNADRAISRAELVATAFGSDYRGVDRTIDVHVMNLRRKIENIDGNGVFIKTVYGVGYMFVKGTSNAQH